MKEKTYRVKLYWEMCAEVEVKATSKTKAIQAAIDGPLPSCDVQEYVPDSANVDRDDVIEVEPVSPLSHPIITQEKLDGIRHIEAVAFQTRPGSCPP